MATGKILLLVLIMCFIILIVIILLEIPIGGRDVSQTPRLYDEKGRLKKKFLPAIVIALVLGVVLLLFNVV